MTAAAAGVPITVPDRSHLGAVVLAGMIEATPIPPAIIEAQRTVPAVHRSIRAVRAPLDLDADVFHYRVDRSEISATRHRRGARSCREPHHRQP